MLCSNLLKFFCAVKVCNEGDIRLDGGGGVSYEGRIEYCSANRWGTICDRGWSALDASVACYQMGYPREGEAMLHVWPLCTGAY